VPLHAVRRLLRQSTLRLNQYAKLQRMAGEFRRTVSPRLAGRCQYIFGVSHDFDTKPSRMIGTFERQRGTAPQGIKPPQLF